MLRQVRRLAVAFVGGIVVAVGVAMLVLPGPAILVIPAGLAILATEFQWARRLLQRVKKVAWKGKAAPEKVTDQCPPKGPQTSATF
jgi:tellurite resistance protein TerC